MVIGVRVESENVTTGKRKHCNSSYFTMVAKDSEGRSTPVPGLIIEDEQGVRRFARSIQRKKQSMSRSSQFESSQFKMNDYLKDLDHENVKINLDPS